MCLECKTKEKKLSIYAKAKENENAGVSAKLLAKPYNS
ncbi:hypothetical protein C5S31_07595 [ANME-1 cluster archaeon GoMg2]|nr:hypothetical protein [ANME-1 cluster archaeon GoMg2]